MREPNHARVEDSGARVILTGDVTLIRAAGKDGEPSMRLTTEKLVALPDLEQFSTDAPVEIERGGSRITLCRHGLRQHQAAP